jgi:hypothetical protein
MTSSAPVPLARVAVVVGRVVAGLVSGAAGIFFLLCVRMAVTSRFELNERDLHGYGLIFGVILGIGSAFVVALTLPLAFPRRRWGQLIAVTMSSFGVTLILLIALIVTA